MMKRVASLAMMAGAVAISYAANAAPNWDGPGKPVPKFGTMSDHSALNYPKGHEPTTTLTQWSGSFTDLTGHTRTFKMAGADPSTSNTDTHIKIVLIPVVLVYGASNGNLTLDPSAKSTGGKGKKSELQMIAASPILDPGARFKSGKIKCGQSQYVDAFQRCNFWSSVQTNTGYHTILDLTKDKKLKPLTITVSSAQGKIVNNPFGSGVVGTMDSNAFNSALISYLTAHPTITPDVFPLFVSYDTYLTSGGCCIGGFHSARGAQSYGYSTYEDSPGSYTEDIDALSHEVAEWMDDPFTNNFVGCQDNSILEVGDPIENLDNYGTFTVKLNKFVWHPQSLAMMPYFGAPTSTSANGWVALHNDITNVCPGQ